MISQEMLYSVLTDLQREVSVAIEQTNESIERIYRACGFPLMGDLVVHRDGMGQPLIWLGQAQSEVNICWIYMEPDGSLEIALSLHDFWVVSRFADSDDVKPCSIKSSSDFTLG